MDGRQGTRCPGRRHIRLQGRQTTAVRSAGRRGRQDVYEGLAGGDVVPGPTQMRPDEAVDELECI